MPLAIFGVTALSSKPSSLLITAVALFISPSQKNSSRSAAFAANDNKAQKTIAKDFLNFIIPPESNSLNITIQKKNLVANFHFLKLGGDNMKIINMFCFFLSWISCEPLQ